MYAGLSSRISLFLTELWRKADLKKSLFRDTAPAFQPPNIFPTKMTKFHNAHLFMTPDNKPFLNSRRQQTMPRKQLLSL